MPSVPEPAAVFGAGVVSAAGGGMRESAEAAFSGACPFAPVSAFKSPRHGGRLAGEAAGIRPEFASLKASKCAKMLLQAASEAVAQAGLGPGELARTGIYLGTSIGGVADTEEALIRFLADESAPLRALRSYECSHLADYTAKRLGLGGPRMTFSTACSSSGVALEAALLALRDGSAGFALVCGVDALSRITLNGFGSLLLLSASACRPFDANRDGINLGEAAGAVLIGRPGSLGSRPLAEILSAACTCDAYHATAPHPGGDGAARAMEQALARAGAEPGEVDFVCAHGTGTQGNDPAEFAAMKRAFGGKIPPYASVKRTFGHTLGASGIINAAVCIRAIESSEIPPNSGFEVLAEGVDAPPNTVRRGAKVRIAMANSLGFGGNNASAVIAAPGLRRARPCAGANAGVELFILSAGTVSPAGNSAEEFQKNFAKGGTFACDTSGILREIPMLKKRRLARLQQMALEAAMQAVAKSGIADSERERAAVCLGTGLGMAAETFRFIKNVIEKSEAEPMPGAFTNSVHNAASSAIANFLGLKGPNAAVTARELSFEAALWHARAETLSGNSPCALVCACDEIPLLAGEFLRRHGIYASRPAPLAEGAAAYFARPLPPADAPQGAMRLAFLRSAPRLRNPRENAERAARELAAAGIAPGSVSRWIFPSSANAFEDRVREEILRAFPAPEPPATLSDSLGGSYINSAYFPMAAASFGRGTYAMHSLSSAGMEAITVMEVL